MSGCAVVLAGGTSDRSSGRGSRTTHHLLYTLGRSPCAVGASRLPLAIKEALCARSKPEERR
jgi:hypothetical protein